MTPDSGTPATRLVNFSARNQVGTGANVLVVGFVISGDAPKTLLIRGVGPTLAQFGVQGVLADPQLALFDASGAIVNQNNDWAVGSRCAPPSPNRAHSPCRQTQKMPLSSSPSSPVLIRCS